jgi:transcriptional regulator with XRE-family HTH domain
MDKTLGQRIRELRTLRKLSLRDLASKSAITPPFLSDIELGRRNPGSETLRTLAQQLETSYEDLLSYDQRPMIETIKARTTNDPRYARLMREVLDRHLTADDLEEFLRK